MKCPICGKKGWVLEQDPLSECGHDFNDIVKVIKQARDHTEVVLIKLKPYTGTRFTVEIIRYKEILNGEHL